MATHRLPATGETDPLTGGTFDPGTSQRPSTAAFENEGADVQGMRVLLVPVAGLTRKGAMVDGNGRPRPFRFQMPPTETFTRSKGYGYTDYDTLRDGQHTRPTGLMLETVRFSTLIMDTDPSWAIWPNTEEFGRAFGFADSTDRDEVWNVLNATDQLENVLKSGTPFRLFAGQPALWQGGGGESGWDVNMLATLRSLNIEERAGEPDARYIDVEFVQWRTATVNRRRLGKKGKTPVARGTAKRPAVVEIYPDGRAFDITTERQVAGVGLATGARLSKLYFGTPTKYPLILQANTALTRANLWPNDQLSKLCARYFGGKPYKLRIPEAREDIAQAAFLDPNDVDVIARVTDSDLGL